MKTMICFDHLSYSQFNYEVITEINNVVLDSAEEICICSMDQTYPFINAHTAIFAPSEMDSFNNGLIISHTLKNAKSILSCANNSQKLLYLYDLDWMFQPILYDDIYETLTNTNLKLILRSSDYIQPIKILCNREPDAIVERFKLEDIWNSL
jgi:hypothetical protein